MENCITRCDKRGSYGRGSYDSYLYVHWRILYTVEVKTPVTIILFRSNFNYSDFNW